MEYLIGLKGIILSLLFIFIGFLLLRLHVNTRISINRWADENKLNIVKKNFMPWHSTWLYGGLHPAKFKIAVQDIKGNKEIYWITGDGILAFKNRINVKKSR